MKKDTRNYGKFHQRFARGGSVDDDDEVDKEDRVQLAGDFPDVKISPQQNQDLNARLRARELSNSVTPVSPLSTDDFLRQRQIDRLSPSSGSVRRYYARGGSVKK